MELNIFYILIFCIGAMFGSFFTLAVYRLPLHENITHERSFCPKCHHKLGFWDMIPILSYIALRGKCRYCKEKIRPRYLILEVCSGIVFLLFTISICGTCKLDVNTIFYIALALLYIAGWFIIAGIDKETRQIHIGVIFYEMCIVAIYMVYLYILTDVNIYRYVIYLFFICLLLILETWYLRKKLKSNYTILTLLIILIMLAFTNRGQMLLTITLTLLAIAIDGILEMFLHKKKHIQIKEAMQLPIAYYICVCHIITLIITNLLVCRW